MQAKVSIIMGSTSDMPIMKQSAEFLNSMEIPFEINALSAHRTPEDVSKFAHSAKEKGIEIIIAGAGMAAHLPGVIASMTTIPVIGVPINATLNGWDAILSIIQMPPGIPVASVGLNAAKNAGILAAQILALKDENLLKKFIEFKNSLKDKIVKANKDLSEIKYEYKVN